MLAEAREGSLIRSSHLEGGEPDVNIVELLFGNNVRIATSLFGTSIGKIEAGYQADLAIYDYHPRTEMIQSNLAAHLLFGLGSPCDVMTGGEFRIRDGRLVHDNEEDIFQRASSASKRLWAAMQAG